MTKADVRILLVEDNEDDYLITRMLLSEIPGANYELDWIATYDEARDAIRKREHQVYLFDHYLGGHTGIDLLRDVVQSGSKAPVIILTGREAHELDVQAMREGAADYLVKGQITAPMLERSIRYSLERARALDALRESEERYALAVRGSNEGLWDWDLRRNQIFYSPRWMEMLGLGETDGGTKPAEWFDRVNPEDLAPLRARLADHLEGRTQFFESEHRMRHRDGNDRWMLSRGLTVRSEGGEPTRMTGSQTDVTERKRAEERLAETLLEIEKSRDDMLSIMNRLRLGTAITDEEGRVTFVSEAAQRLLGRSQGDSRGTHWEDLWPLSKDDLVRLREVAQQPPEQRTKVPVRLEARGGRNYFLDVEVQDDPRDTRRKIFLLYDVTEVQDLRRLLDEKAQFQDLIGKSEPMRLIYQQIRDLATVDSTVLIEGETGTGKELAARAVHYASHRKKNAFIAVNCAGLTESLLGSQLFGHKRGAFTGAVEDHQGLFEAANGGSIFLDEIGDIPMSVQTSLLRVLQEREITRVGESRARKIDVRVIAASHQNLQVQVEKGTFRLDLLYRIRVIRIVLPPLRDRREDIPLLVGSFMQKFRAASGKPIHEMSTDALGMLMSHAWPGNVRELQSAIEYAGIRCKGSIIQPEDLPPEVVQLEGRLPLAGAKDEQDEKRRLLAALQQAKGNRTSAARLLGVSRATLYRRLGEFGISRAE